MNEHVQPGPPADHALSDQAWWTPPGQAPSLEPWQRDACRSWEHGDPRGAHRGTLEIFTGGGKSLIALECLRRAARAEPDLRAVVVVPTIALARQWRKVILANTRLEPDEVGALGGDHKDDLRDKRVLVAVLNSAAEHLPSAAASLTGELMLIIDECHRAGAPRFSRVLNTRARYRLGLSATAVREDVDDDGDAIAYDAHALGRLLGEIVYRFDLRDARRIGWLPAFEVHHHGVSLSVAERQTYNDLSRKVDDLLDRLKDAGIETSRARQVARTAGEEAETARAYVAVVALRKDLLYRAQERSRVVAALVADVSHRTPAPRVMLFHERIDEAAQLHAALAASGLSAGLEHSRLPSSTRQLALEQFADGTVPILVSVKSLVEGIDVPDADIGFSVASSSSVRQRVQALGRVLRRRFDGTRKNAEMHLVYVMDTVDEAIYGKTDWSDLTGAEANHYSAWDLGSERPSKQDGPPLTPRPTEEQVLDHLSDRSIPHAVLWDADWPRAEWRLDSRGTVTDLGGRVVANPQGVSEAVASIKPRGGRFRVSTAGSVVVPDLSDETPRAWLVKLIDEPFTVHESEPPSSDPPETGQRAPDSADVPPPSYCGQPSGSEVPVLINRDHSGSGTHNSFDFATPTFSATESAAKRPGDPILTPPRRHLGPYRIRQKKGGLIERRTELGAEFAGTEDDQGSPELISNARRVLEAWRATGESGLSFDISTTGEAFYRARGEARYLAPAPGGFAWPSDEA